MTTDWTTRLTAPIEAAEHGIAASDTSFASTHDGPLNYNQISYPAAQVYVENVERTSGTTWQMHIGTTLYFEWGRDTSVAPDVVHPLAAVLEETLGAFDGVDCIGDYHPSRIDFFSGEPGNSLVLAVSVQFRVSLLLDPGEFA